MHAFGVPHLALLTRSAAHSPFQDIRERLRGELALLTSVGIPAGLKMLSTLLGGGQRPICLPGPSEGSTLACAPPPSAA